MMRKKEKEINSAEAGMEKQDDKMVEIKDSEYQKILKETTEYKDKHVRLYAEFDNVRKRNERERIEFLKYANEGLMGEFLAILDDLERSVAAAQTKHEDYNAFLKGIEMVMAHLYEMLKKNNVKPIESVGKKFDPHCHEILMPVVTDKIEDGMIVEEFQKGYLLGDRILRTAKVKVAVNNSKESDKPSSDESLKDDSAGEMENKD